MTTYFDDLTREVRDQCSQLSRDEPFLLSLEHIEERVVQDVTLCTGDREFPDDLRQEIMGVIAVNRVRTVEGMSNKANWRAATMRCSPLLISLHQAFHSLASLRVQTRFGILTDDPRANWRDRDAHDENR
jgi:hypothetical protein